MLNKLLKDTKFQSEINNFFSQYKDQILDIIIFGSTIKGKEKPADIDILIIYKNKEDLELNYKLKKNLDNLKLNFEITSITYKKLFNPNFIIRESLLLEGYSLLNKNFIAESLGYKSFVLFRYNLKKFNKSQRMRFYYSLYGRKNSLGIIQELYSYKLSNTVIATPIIYSEKMKDYLNNWNLEYVEIPILVSEKVINAKNFKLKDV